MTNMTHDAPNRTPYVSRTHAVTTAFDWYLAGDWSLAYVVALAAADVPDPDSAAICWRKGPGSRFFAYIYTPNADIPLRARKPRNT